MLRWARSALFDLWFYASMAAMGVLFAPLALVSRPGTYWAIKLFCAQAFFALRLLCGLRVEVRGPVPAGRALIAAKHQSFLDILILAHALERPAFVMKRSLIYAPILGFYAMRIGAAPVNRGGGAEALRRMRARLAADVEKAPDRQVVIYPQGTRVAPGAPERYRTGVAALYADEPGGCVLAATNAGVFWGRKSILKRPGRAVVEFLAPPVAPGLSRAEVMREIETRIEAASDRLLAEAETPERAPASA